jgi:hypothetical protein
MPVKEIIKKPSEYVLNAKAGLKALGCTDISKFGTGCTFNGKRYSGMGCSTAEAIGDMIQKIGKDIRSK